MTEKSVLIIDDNGFMIGLIKNALRYMGLRVWGAPSLASGRSLIQKLKPDVIILDRHMPGEDGHELLKELRNDHRFRNIPVMILSAENAQEEIFSSLRLGANDYMLKPFRNIDLSRKVNRLLKAPHYMNPDQCYLVS